MKNFLMKNLKGNWKRFTTAELIITGAEKGTSREGLYKELGLEPLCDRRCYHKLVFFHKKKV